MIKPLQSITLKNDNGEDTTYVVASAPAIVETTEPASVASFSDGAEGIPVSSLIADINPVQTGSGDPSPSNVRPITGWTGMNITRTGKNLFDVNARLTGQTNASGTPLSSPAYTLSNGVVSISSSLVTYGRRMFSSMWLIPATYTISFVPTLSGTNEAVGRSVRLMDDPKSDIVAANSIAVVNGQRTSFSFTVTVEGNYAISLQPANAASGTLQMTDIQLERSASASDYEPYNGTTYPISWEDEAGTVYGGTLDVTTGLLTVTQAIDTFDGTNKTVTSVAMSSVSGYYYALLTLSNPRLTTTGTSNYLALGATPTQISHFSMIGNNITSPQVSVVLPDQTLTTAAAYNTYLQSNPLQIMYPLNTPVTYQLTPQAVLTILGQNNIWADTGDVEVAYCADTKMYIDKVIAAL